MGSESAGNGAFGGIDQWSSVLQMSRVPVAVIKINLSSILNLQNFLKYLLKSDSLVCYSWCRDVCFYHPCY